MADNATERPATSQASSRRLLNATAVMASGTLISRILGFARSTLLVIVLGASTPQAEAFTLATLVPNTLYMLVAGGALNTVLVPQIVRHVKNDPDAGEAFVNRIVTAFLVLLLAVTALATALTPQVMSLWTAGEWRTPAMEGHWQKLVLLAFLTMPQLFFYGAFFLVGQVLNARDKFGPMMWAPILNNVVGIAVLGIYVVMWGLSDSRQVPFTGGQVLLLGIGSTLGIAIQTLALIPAVRQIGFHYRPRWDLKGQGLGETFHLAKWMLGYVLVTSAVQVVVSKLGSTATASEAGAGAGVAVYNTAYLVWILPHSLITVSLATAMLPSATRLAAVRDMAGVAAETARTMRLALTFLLPASAAFVVLGLPFTRIAFGHGAASGDWSFIGWTLMAFAVGLVPYTMQYVYLRGFYALEDTRTPFLLQLAISGTNVALAFGLMAVGTDPATVAPRLALAYSVSYAVGAVVTDLALRRRLPDLPQARLGRFAGRLLLAVLPGAVLAAVVTWWFGSRDSLALVVAGFLLALLVAMVAYFFVAKRLGIAEATQLLAVLRRRSPGTAAPDDTTLERNDTAVRAASDDSPPANDVVPAADVYDEPPLLDYPDPSDGHRPATSIPAGLYPVGAVQVGQVLDDRYRLDEILHRRGGTLTWRGTDLKLSRPVLVHVMHPHEPRALEILDQARNSAPAVDSRFLRVWDAVLVEGQPHGSYIVCEYAPGRSLELVLRTGPLSDVEAAWLVREVAHGLAGMHAQDLHHRQLNPDTIIVTASGNVKVVGFLIEDVLSQGPRNRDGEASDVRALGELLYAAVLARWPGAPRYGLPAAPTDAKGRPLLPRQASPRVSIELSDIVDRILSAVPRGGATRLTTAQDVAAALSRLLAGADASHALAERLHFPIEQIRFTGHAGRRPVPAAGGRPSATAAVTAGLDTTGAPDAADSASEDTQAMALDAPGGPGDDDPRTEPFTPIPPPAGRPAARPPAPPPQPSRRWQATLLGLFGLALLVGLVMVFVVQYQRIIGPGAPSPAHAIASARDFDPSADGGDDAENPDLAPLAVDGDPATAWTTERYGRSSDFNGRKPGAGVVVDLGEARPVGRVTVDLGVGPTTADIRVPADASVQEPPLRSRDQWRVVATIAPSTGQVEVRLPDRVTTRFVLVYLTSMPAVGPNWVGSIHEIAVAP